MAPLYMFSAWNYSSAAGFAITFVSNSGVYPFTAYIPLLLIPIYIAYRFYLSYHLACVVYSLAYSPFLSSNSS